MPFLAFLLWTSLQVGQDSSLESTSLSALERIACPSDYSAFLFARGLAAPDGLAFDGDGRLCVVEERAGRVTRLDRLGNRTVLVEGLHSPEGICLGPEGVLLVVEDAPMGRLLSIGPGGEVSVLAQSLHNSEGVIWSNGSVYLTQSILHAPGKLFDPRTRVSCLPYKEKEWGNPRQVISVGFPYLFSELLSDGSGHLILANEIAGPLNPSGLLQLDLDSGEYKRFAKGLVSPEGLAWSTGSEGGFPLYVAEEDVDGKGHGRVSRVDSEGQRTDFATGFGTIEDVVLDAEGSLFVSEDSTGLVIEIRPRH